MATAKARITILVTHHTARGHASPFNDPLIESMSADANNLLLGYASFQVYSAAAGKAAGVQAFKLGFYCNLGLGGTSDCAPQRLQVHKRMCVAQGVAIHWCISMHAHNHFYRASNIQAHVLLDMIEYAPAHKTRSQQRFISELEYSAIIPQLNTDLVTAQRLLPPCALLQTAQIRRLTHDARSLP